MDKQIGPYDIVRLIGAGGMGSVYEALHSQIQRRAAIKILHRDFQKDPEFLQRFFNEARAVNIINHPSVVSVYDFGSALDGSPYIVMEYLEGESLRQRLARSGRLAPETALRIGRQVASGLAAAHSKHVVHRDLKPVNIMLVPDSDSAEGERAKILDFGIAKLSIEPGAKSLTRVGASVGTPAYMSPEQCKSAHDVADRSDVYSLGLILFEMLSGEHPFAEARSDSAMMASHIGKPPPPLDSKAPGLSPELCALVDRMLAKQPDVRQSAAEAAATLGRLGGSSTGLLQIISSQPDSPGEPQSREQAPSPPPADAPELLLAALRRRLQGGKGIIIGAAAALLLGAIGLIVAVRILLESPPPEQVQVHFTLKSDPSDAEVVDATGQVLGKTPFERARPRSPGVEVLSIRREGYAAQRIALATDRDAAQTVVLTALATPPPPSAALKIEQPRQDAQPAETRHSKHTKKSKKPKLVKKVRTRHRAAS